MEIMWDVKLAWNHYFVWKTKEEDFVHIPEGSI